MTSTLTGPVATPPDPTDRPNRKQRVSRDGAVEFGGSAVASLAAAWVVFTLASLATGFGLFFCWYALFFIVYGILLWRRHGVLLMKDRLATVAVWTGAVVALVALLAVVIYVVVKGAPVVFANFPNSSSGT